MASGSSLDQWIGPDFVAHIITHTLYYQQQKMRTFSVTYQQGR